jgi:hypothetical protein
MKKLRKSNIFLVGENILYDNGIVNAFYILPSLNYTISSKQSIRDNTRSLVTMLGSLASTREDIQYTIERLDKVVKKDDVIRNIIDSVRLYKEDYELPPLFRDSIKDDMQTYCLLAISIDTQEVQNLEDLTFTGAMKTVAKKTLSALSGLGEDFDEERAIAAEKAIFDAIKHRCVRASKEIIFYNYASKLFPNYEISYDRIGFFREENLENVLGSLQQIVLDKFGYLELTNFGAYMFDLPQKTTYATVLTIKNFPIKIDPTAFPLNYPNCQVNIQMLSKKKAMLKFKRARSAANYDEQTMVDANAATEDLDEVSTVKELTNMALSELQNDEPFCKFNVSFLLYGETLEELRASIRRVVAELHDKNDVSVIKSLNQAEDFLDRLQYRCKNYEHTGSLEFPLSFQLNSGSRVGDDLDGKIYSPAIGVDIS